MMIYFFGLFDGCCSVQFDDVGGYCLETSQLLGTNCLPAIHKDNLPHVGSLVIVFDPGSLLCCCHLRLDLGLDFGKRSGTKIIVIYAHIVLQRE